MGKKFHILFYFVIIELLAVSLFIDINFAADEHIWLHVEGKYVRTSPYANPPNEIFVAAGIAKRGHTNNGALSAVVDWAKTRYSNCIRFDTYGYKDYDFSGVDNIISNEIDPFVQLCKSNQIYVYLDCHEYFHQPPWQDGWFPTGPVWNDATFQGWIDYWVTIATYYENEPWVLGYELCNEPCNIAAELSRTKYMQCIQAIRQVDTKHIILLGNNSYSHTKNMELVWGPVDFMPDIPYNQVSFVFHEYTNADNPDIVQPILDDIQNTYNVSVFCTEFGAAETVGGLTEEMKRQFETDMFAMFAPRYIGWSIWVLNGVCPNGSLEYENIWVPAAQAQGSPIPVSSGITPEATQIICSAYPDTLFADGISSATIVATICDVSGCRLFTENGTITFDITGEGTWEDETTESKPVSAVEGIAAINIKSTNTPGIITVTANSGVLSQGSVDVPVLSAPVKVTLTANPTTLPADGASFSLITAYIKDAQDNTVETITEGTFYFNVSGPGSLWITETIPGESRSVQPPGGITYIFLKAGTTSGNAVVTGNFGLLTPGSTTVYIGQAADTTPPTDIGEVRDGTNWLLRIDIDSTNSTTELSANWDASNDPESGISRYDYCIGTSQGSANIVDWTDNGTSKIVTHTGLSLTIGTTYYFTVKAENGVNLQSNPTNSDGQTILTGPILSLDKTYLDFGEIEKGRSKVLPFTITNIGEETLSGTITDDREWIIVNPTSFNSNYEMVWVLVTNNELADGQYTGTISITSNGGNAEVTVEVTAISSGNPILVVDPTVLDFGEIELGRNKVSSFTITNIGTGIMGGTISDDRDWITLDPTSFDSNNQTVYVLVDNNVLNKNEGQYTGTVSITSNGGNGEVTIKVTATCVFTRPNPYNPRRGNLTFFGSGVANGTIKIYTLTGELVRTLEEPTGNDTIEWNGRNESGKEVISGIYLYTTENSSEKNACSFTIIKK